MCEYPYERKPRSQAYIPERYGKWKKTLRTGENIFKSNSYYLQSAFCMFLPGNRGDYRFGLHCSVAMPGSHGRPATLALNLSAPHVRVVVVVGYCSLCSILALLLLPSNARPHAAVLCRGWRGLAGLGNEISSQL